MKIENPPLTHPYTIRFEQRKEYLYVRVMTKSNSPDVLISYWQAIADAVLKNDASRLMVEKGKAPEASTVDAFTVAASLRNMGLHGIPIALVKHSSVSAESNRFVETVARNRGVMMGVFDNIAEAEEWLVKT